MITIETTKKRAKLYKVQNTLILANSAKQAETVTGESKALFITYASIIEGAAVFQDGKAYDNFIVAI